MGASSADAASPAAELQARARLYAGYDRGDYVSLHPDLASVEPDQHFLEYGLWEQRPAVTPERFIARLASARLDAARLTDPVDLQPQYRFALGLTARLHAPLSLTSTTTEVVRCLLAGLERLGLSAELYLSPPRPGAVGSIVIAPAAVFGAVSRGTADLQLYQSCLMVTDKAPGDGGFGAELPFLLGAGAVAAFEPDTAALMAEAGAPTAWLSCDGFSKLGETPSAGSAAGLGRAVKAFDLAGPWSERPLDLAAIQALTPARDQAWSRIAGRMQGLTTVVRSDDGETGPARASRRYVFERSKLALHLDAGGFAPPPWRWLEDVAAAGAALVSEPAGRHPLLRNGVNHFEAPVQHLPELIEHLVKSTEGRLAAEAAAASLRRTLAHSADPETNGLQIVRLLNAARGARP